jgi:hypothetical protein
VRFGEQLSFKVDNPPLFAGEEPTPIEFKNNLKTGIPRPKTSNKKTKKGTKKNNFSNAWMPPNMLKNKSKRPASAKPKQNAETPQWNDNTRA